MASISAENRDCVLVAGQRAKFPIAIKCASRLGEHKWSPILIKEHGFGIEEAVSFATLSASRMYRDFHPRSVRERGKPLCDGIPIAEIVTLEVHLVRTEEVIPLREGCGWDANRLALLVHVSVAFSAVGGRV